MERIALGTDHRGYELKEYIKAHYNDLMDIPMAYAIEWVDVGCFSSDRTDYPVYGKKVVDALRMGSVKGGVLLCGSGVGMGIVANRFTGIFAGVVWNETIARLAREDDNCSIICLPADFVTPEQACRIIFAWQQAHFKGGRYAERLIQIDEK